MLANESFSASSGYFDPNRALSGGGIFDRFVSAATMDGKLTHQSAWPLWLGIVGVGAAVVILTKGKK